MSINIEDGPPMTAELLNFATCSAASDERLTVEFSGGVLQPTGECDREAWRKTFGPALAAKPGKRARLMDWLLGKMMGLVKPKVTEPAAPDLIFTPAHNETNPSPKQEMSDGDEMRYQMTKAPKGYLDVLYLDDELRITRGNRGSLVVCERQQ
eukprot:1269651-Prymnesium_polylepis.1